MSRSGSAGFSSRGTRGAARYAARRAPLLPMLGVLSACISQPRPTEPAVIPAALSVPPGYSLVWRDEFDEGPQPDPAKWAYDEHRNRQGWYNDELQYYGRRARNIRIDAGMLVIEAHAERLNRADYRDWGGQSFTSGRLVSRGRARWREGYFEIRARLPCVAGTWPAAWLLPEYESSRWEGGEIDIFEHVGADPGKVHHSLQTATRNFRIGNHPTATSMVPDACTAFHTYQLLWTGSMIVMGVDGRIGFAMRRERLDRWFDRPMYLILNLAIGGHWGGPVDAGRLPASMQIDYVRVYGK
ncbi:glycoside hydrolase family 16 protein [Rhizorhabdus histidinilytica]|nr:glycoside hydrolase family 16 protein [Rhizorhabdus histidinilytica]